MNLRQAAQQALEALEWVWGGEPLTGKELDAITALRAALAEPEQEPQTTHWEGCEAVHPECKGKK
jgi:hypothetical protein